MEREEKKRRELTEQEKLVHQNLVTIYNDRKIKGLVQNKLAKQMGMSQVGVSKYLTGEQALNNYFTMIEFSKGLQCRPDELWPFLLEAGIGINPDEQVVLETYRMLSDSDKRYFLRSMEKTLDSD